MSLPRYNASLYLTKKKKDTSLYHDQNDAGIAYYQLKYQIAHIINIRLGISSITFGSSTTSRPPKLHLNVWVLNYIWTPKLHPNIESSQGGILLFLIGSQGGILQSDVLDVHGLEGHDMVHVSGNIYQYTKYIMLRSHIHQNLARGNVSCSNMYPVCNNIFEQNDLIVWKK